MEKPEYFIVAPSTKLFGGVKVEKNTEFETWNDDKTVHQTLNDLELVTEVIRESDYNGIKSKEESKMTTKLPEGIVLVWGEQEGYIVPNYHMVKIDEAQKKIEQANGDAKAQIIIAEAAAQAATAKIIELGRALGYTITEDVDADGITTYVVDVTSGPGADKFKLVVEDYLQYLAYLEKWDGNLPDVVSGDDALSIIVPNN